MPAIRRPRPGSGPKRLLGLALSLIAWVTLPASAEQGTPKFGDNPMSFVVVRKAVPDCEPACPEWIQAEGDIMAKTPARLNEVLQGLHGRKLPIVISSGGGDVEAALQLGRLIRKNKLDVAVGHTAFVGCHPDHPDCKDNDAKGSRYMGMPYAFEAFCASACPLAMAGGVRRYVTPGTFVGVHQVTTTVTQERILYETKYRLVNGKKKILSKTVVGRKSAGSYKLYEMTKAQEKRIAAYLAEMGVDRKLLDIAKETPASGIRQLTAVEMSDAKFVTSNNTLDALTSTYLCRRVPAADNCRLFTDSDLKP